MYNEKKSWLGKLGDFYLYVALLIGFVITAINYFKTTIAAEVSDGRRYVWLSLLVVAVFIVLQFIKFKNPFTSKLSKSKKFEIFISVAAGIGYMVIVLLTTYLTEFTNISTPSFLNRFQGIITLLGDQYGGTIPQLLFLFFKGLVISGTLLSLFLCGIVITGLNLSFALHNWLNGMEFDIGIFIENLIGLALNDFASLVVNIILFALSWNFLSPEEAIE